MSGFSIMVVLICVNYYSSNPTVAIGNVFIPLPLILVFTLIISGLTGTARLYLKAHTLPQVLWGYSVGILSMVGAYLFIFSNAQ
jgi:membrane-associated phospholipid phosphatase